MSELKINNTTFHYPDPGNEPGWGADATDWASAVTDVLNSLIPAGTINETQSTIDLNATNKAVTALVFNQALSKAATVTYRIERTTSSTNLFEKGTLEIMYDPSQVSPWLLSRVIDAGSDALVNIDIDSTGQVKYTSQSIPGTGYNGFMRFKTASSILK